MFTCPNGIEYKNISQELPLSGDPAHNLKFAPGERSFADQQQRAVKVGLEFLQIATLDKMGQVRDYLDNEGSGDRFFLGLHNMNKAADSATADLKWHLGEHFDRALLGAIADVDVSLGEYCMTIRLSSSDATRVVLEDVSCLDSVRSVQELDCYNLCKYIGFVCLFVCLFDYRGYFYIKHR